MMKSRGDEEERKNRIEKDSSSEGDEADDGPMKRLLRDEDIQAETKAYETYEEESSIATNATLASDRESSTHKLRIEDNPFTLIPGTGGHKSSAVSLRLVKEAGGLRGLEMFAKQFYVLAFRDPHIDRFIRDHEENHGERFAAWIAEKFGLGSPWTRERRSRKECPFRSHGHTFWTAHDRSSAHYAAWHSPKRLREDFGKHFKLDDCRVWMRLHFWALRMSGIVDRSPAFTDYYVKFIGHFVSIYERTATAFARESFRWSANSKNLDKYVKSGRRMYDVIGLSHSEALRQLPKEEALDETWPYPRR